MQLKHISNENKCFVYIISGRKEISKINITSNVNFIFKDLSDNSSKLIYIEIFYDRKNAIRKKRYLTGISEAGRLKLIKKKNPDMLNLMFTLFDN